MTSLGLASPCSIDFTSIDKKYQTCTNYYRLTIIEPMELHEIIKNLANKAIDDQIFPGCQIGFFINGKIELFAFGRQTYDLTSPLINDNTIYDVASITKAIPTNTLALKLIGEEKLAIDQKLIDIIPEIQSNFRDGILIKHLLTQTLDYQFHLSKYKDLSPSEILEIIFNAKLASPPGTSFYYSNATSILLGLVVERVSGRSLDEYANEAFFTPLGMNRTGYNPLARFKLEEIAPSEIDPWRKKEIRGEVHDESAHALIDPVGSAGVFSTASDLMKFTQMIIAGGKLDGRQYLDEKIVPQIWHNQLAAIDKSHGLGWELNQPWFMGQNCPEDTFGKTGFTGCTIVASRSQQKAVVILSNWTYPKRNHDKTLLNDFRQKIADLVWNM